MRKKTLTYDGLPGYEFMGFHGYVKDGQILTLGSIADTCADEAAIAKLSGDLGSILNPFNNQNMDEVTKAYQ